jgi:hypothetical protein
MSEMATDDMSDGVGFSMSISEFVKALRAKPESETPNKPLLVYSPDPWAFLKRIPKTTVRPNPYAVNDLSEGCKDRGLLDLYTERRQRAKGETPKVDLDAIEALDKSELIDLYQERKLRKRK